VTIQQHPKVSLIQHAGDDVMVAAAAKVSTTGDEARNLARIEEEGGISGLIRYLVKHRHGSPFEHGMMTFFVHAPIFVIRELQRHRIASYNEESGRYKQLEPVFWSPSDERKIAKTENYTSARPTFEPGTSEQFALIRKHDELFDQLYAAYEEEIAAGIGNEVARRLLPLSTYSSLWVTMNPRALMNFLSLRIHADDATFVSYPQREIEEVAETMEAAFAEHWPLVHKAFVRNGRVAP
jgi:thymidylate synthase (FAD)